MQSYIFDFRKSPTFFQKWNKEFDVENVNGEGVLSASFKLVLCNSVCDDNISDCLNSNGRLKYSSSNLREVSCQLRFVQGENSDTISLVDDTSFEFGEDFFDMKGAFLTTSNGYVVGYSINQQSLNITNEMIFEKDLVFFTIVEGVLNG